MIDQFIKLRKKDNPNYKDEIAYLQEALKKTRVELDDEKRMNSSLKNIV